MSCQRAITKLRGQYGAYVTASSSGTSALELLKGNSYNLIISDIVMEDMNGWELYAILRQDLGIIEAPILFYSALVDELQASFLDDGPEENSMIVSQKSGALIILDNSTKPPERCSTSGPNCSVEL